MSCFFVARRFWGWERREDFPFRGGGGNHLAFLYVHSLFRFFFLPLLLVACLFGWERDCENASMVVLCLGVALACIFTR